MFKLKDTLLLRMRAITMDVISGGSQLGTVLSASTGFVNAEQAYSRAMTAGQYDEAEKHINTMQEALVKAREIVGNYEAGTFSL